MNYERGLKACLWLFLLSFPLSLWAENQEPQNSTDAVDSELEEINLKIQSFDPKSVQFKDFISEATQILTKLESDDKLKESFMLGSLGSKFEDLVLASVQSLSVTGVGSSLSNVEKLIVDLKKVYPAASPLIFKVNKLVSGVKVLSACEEGINYPNCLWEIAFKSENPIEDAKRLSKRVDKELNSNSVSDLEYLLLAIVEADYFKSSESTSQCADIQKSKMISRELSSASKDEVIVKEIALLESSLGRESKCRNLVNEVFPKFVLEVCRKGFSASCMKSFQILDFVGLDTGSMASLKRSFILFASGDEQTKLAESMMTKEVFSGFSTTDRLKLVAKGEAPRGVYVLIFVIVFLPAMFFVLSSFIPIVFRGKGGSSGLPLPDLNVDLSEFKNFYDKLIKKGAKGKGVEEGDPGLFKLSEKEDEYSLLLKVFGLSEESSTSDIKQAYRDLVKQLHPDSGAIDPVSQAEFERVQLAYDRLMELRRGWFGLARD